MNFWTVTMVSLVIGLLLVIGGALVLYMGSLVKNAYQLKVEIQNDLEAGLKRVEEESEKKTRWIKRDLVEEIDKMKTALSTDNQRKLGELTDSLAKRVEEIEQSQKRDRQDLTRIVEAMRQDIMTLDQRIKSLRHQPAAKAEVSASAENAEATPALPAPSETPMAAPPVPDTVQTQPQDKSQDKAAAASSPEKA
ncbi:MAG TPA: hypothetical protein VM661_08695 [Candidatus Sulfotelmatobacter sp.]|jgi:multidrug efflux pump subunit AcrB|nr:hypothetical protein [Candidatus Sulfotelmatobacter sp.]